ncbi:MAG: MBOAT family protein [Verrucomicrobiota bacterium]|jgi:alginate O-acetyltransferase complex protein AlgI|nr:MBOAT family protein [Verrucomicrobiota bacterium]
MLFNSYEFLFFLLPIILAGYYLVLPKPFRNGWLLVCSYVFYGWWDIRYCSLLLLVTSIDYVAGKRISMARTKSGRRGWLAAAVCCDLSILGFFKYYDFGAAALNGLADVLGGSAPVLPILHIALPIGISFYVFQSMSYSIDIYRGIAKPAHGFIDFACYVSLFPQLIAGPIVRYHELAGQLQQRTHSTAKAGAGIAIFILGLAKKVILADSVSLIADWGFGASGIGFWGAWTSLAAYTLQIYFDFSGYSDMAVGLGLLFGFQFPQNFNSPYKSASITEFWRRWHISLSSWLRDNLYIPLGGNRKGEGRTYFNLFATMLLGGLWHGSSWTFVLWGAYHGIWLALERRHGKGSYLRRFPRPVQIGGTFLIVMLGWLLFRSTSLQELGWMLQGLAGWNGLGGGYPLGGMGVAAWAILLLGLWMVFACRNTWEIRLRPTLMACSLLLVLFVACVAIILLNTSSPFLYFQF